MSTIKELYGRIEKMDTGKIIRESLQASTEVLADLNAQQMFQGLRSDGSEILPSYTDMTIAIKEEKGQVTDRVTLNDTGDFYEEIKVDVDSDKVIFNSTNEKTEKLEKKYSKKKGSIFGLNDQFKRVAREDKIQPEFNKRIEAATGLKMK